MNASNCKLPYETAKGMIISSANELGFPVHQSASTTGFMITGGIPAVYNVSINVNHDYGSRTFFIGVFTTFDAAEAAAEKGCEMLRNHEYYKDEADELNFDPIIIGVALNTIPNSLTEFDLGGYEE